MARIVVNGTTGYTDLTEDDRVRLARGTRHHWKGPPEAIPCEDHPERLSLWRWWWRRGEGPEQARLEQVADCGHPDHDDVTM